MQCQNQVSMLADIVASIANDLRLRSVNIPNSGTIIWVTEDDSFNITNVSMKVIKSI